MNRDTWIQVHGISLGLSIGSLFWFTDPKVAIVGFAMLIPSLIFNGIAFWKVVFSIGGN